MTLIRLPHVAVLYCFMFSYAFVSCSTMFFQTDILFVCLSTHINVGLFFYSVFFLKMNSELMLSVSIMVAVSYFYYKAGLMRCFVDALIIEVVFTDLRVS